MMQSQNWFLVHANPPTLSIWLTIAAKNNLANDSTYQLDFDVFMSKIVGAYWLRPEGQFI